MLATTHVIKPILKAGEYGNGSTGEDLARGRYKMARYNAQLGKGIRTGPEVLKIGEVAIGTLGNFSASIGKAKSKKTFNVSAMVAALSEGKFLTTQRTS